MQVAKKTILVVDDDPIAVENLIERLENSYEVLTARDGLGAVYMYERHNDRIVAAIVKLKLPRLDGCVVSEWVHHKNPNLPVILLDNKKALALMSEVVQSSTHFLSTPLAPFKIESVLREIL